MDGNKAKSYNEQVKIKNKAVVNGYVREIEKKSFSNHTFYRTIPMVINYCC